MPSLPPLPRHPVLFQINTRVWLGELGGRATLDHVPDAALDEIAASGFDWVWLLGVWQTGEAGRAVSRAHPEWQHEYRALLPDVVPDDIAGSPFAIRNYVVHADFGGRKALARLRGRLAARGLRLMLDFVPNHTALDHPWVRTHPEWYVTGSGDDLAREPRNWVRLGARVLAHGRDPYFPGWPDTLQVNYRHAGLRAAMTDVLVSIAAECDGVRCDMAMLVLPDVIARTWGERARPADGSAPVDAPFWPEAIAAVRRGRPDFVFMAEAYWDLEWTLQQQGFDYTYDKRLCDRLHGHDAAGVRGHLGADPEFRRRSVRFLENHDEPRAAATFADGAHQAAAVVTLLVPGLRFVHEGQRVGRRLRASNHLRRRAHEPADVRLYAFYERLLASARHPLVRDGDWRLLEIRQAWNGNPTHERFLAFLWECADRRLLVAVNYGPTQGQCWVELATPALAGGTWRLRDLLDPAVRYERDGDELATRGLYLDVPAWGRHVFELTRPD